MNMHSIHHISIVVRDLETACERYSVLLGSSPEFDELALRQVKTAAYSVGSGYIVLVQPLVDDCAVGQILAKKGEGVFLVSIGVNNIDETLARLELDAVASRQGIKDWLISDMNDYYELGLILQLTQDPLKD